MNKNLDGSPLTREQLITLAIDHGILTRDQVNNIIGPGNENLINSKLLQVTAKLRFDKFMRGELSLNTRTEATSKAWENK